MFDISVFRIDSRLLHGQVVTSWARNSKVERIIVVSDTVAHDSFRKTLILNAAPAGVKANVIPVERAIRLNQDPRFAGMRVMMLVETPQDAKRLVEGGFRLSEVNVGSLSYQHGKKMITDTIAVDEGDIEVLTWLHKKNISFDIRKVVSDSKKDLWKVLLEQKLVS